MTEKYNIAGYCRISVDEELDRDNTSIENQKSIISDYVERTFPGSSLVFYEDRDRSGYTFEQREGYQKMRPLLMNKKYDLLVVKDFSRFSRRNSRGLVELEDLRDAGVRIVSIGDSIDYPTYDDWTSIQFRFLVNEMPVTDASKKVRSVIKRRQEDARWICAVPYGYVITNSKTMSVEVDHTEADVIRKIFDLYNSGWGYKKIANYLTDEHIPTPRMDERCRKEAKGEECKIKVRPEWSIVTVQGILANDFYIGTLRQGKYTRAKINGSDIKRSVDDHLVFENHHEAIVDYRTFAICQEELKKRSNDNYRGVRKNENVYSGLLVCGDCGSPMFAMGRSDLKEAYRCGLYHRRGLKGCTSHHIRADVLDGIVKSYLSRVKDNSAQMIKRLEYSIKHEKENTKTNVETLSFIERQIDDAKEELKTLARQKTRELMRKPESEEIIDETYDELISECQNRLEGLQNQMEMTQNKQNMAVRVNRIAKTAINVFDEILDKDRLDRVDLELVVEKIVVFEDHVDIRLKPDIDSLLICGTLANTEVEEGSANFDSDIADSSQTRIVQASAHRLNKVYDVNVISEGDPLEIFTNKDGEVIFKKYSPIGELSDFAGQMCESLHKSTDSIAAVCDRDNVISISGGAKKELMDKSISSELERIMEGRGAYRQEEGGSTVPVSDNDDRFCVSVAAPIITEGDVMGCVIFVTPRNSPPGTDVEFKLAQTVAAFLGKQMET